MVEARERRRRVSEELRKELRINEQRRVAIDAAIFKLKSVDREVTGSLTKLDDERKERENLKERRRSERQALIERKTCLQSELSELEGKLRGEEQAQELFPAEMEALQKKEDGILERAEAKVQQIRLSEGEAQTHEAEHPREEQVTQPEAPPPAFP